MSKQSALPKQCPSCGGGGCGTPCEYGDDDKQMLFLTSWPSGKLKLVNILGKNKNIKGGIYIRYATGGTDTTTNNFLFNIPSSLKAQLRDNCLDAVKSCQYPCGDRLGEATIDIDELIEAIKQVFDNE